MQNKFNQDIFFKHGIALSTPRIRKFYSLKQLVLFEVLYITLQKSPKVIEQIIRHNFRHSFIHFFSDQKIFFTNFMRLIQPQIRCFILSVKMLELISS